MSTETRRVEVDGIPVDVFDDEANLFDRALDLATPGARRVVLHLNVHGANLAATRPLLRRCYHEADLVYCDGAGIVLGSRILGRPLPRRFTAADWLETLLQRAKDRERTVYFLAGAPGVTEDALARFRRTIPDHSIVGAHHGYIQGNATLTSKVIDEINTLRPHLLFVGMGMPLQEQWLFEHRERLEIGVGWALGATLDYLTGRVPRVPRWMGDAGFEWLFRLGAEPRRLAHRYIIGNPRFLARVTRQAVRERVVSRFRTSS